MAKSLIIGMPVEFEPKRENRFFAEFPTELGIDYWKVQEFKRPKMTIASVEIPFINETNYVAGKYKWEPMEIKFLDPIGPSTTQPVMEWVRLHAESLTGREGYSSGYKKTIVLKSLDPTGVEVEKWTLEDCQIVDVDFGQNSMSSDALQMITVTVQPHRCISNM